MLQILSTIFLVVYTLTIIGVVLVIITDNRNPLKTLPWILVLVLAPGAVIGNCRSRFRFRRHRCSACRSHIP